MLQTVASFLPRSVEPAFYSLLVFLYVFYRIWELQRNQSRPPLLKYWIPWVGSAIELGKDQDAFISRATKELGPIFRVHMAGQEFTYVTSPELMSAIYRDSKMFAFSPIRLEMSIKLFGLSKECVYSSYMVDDMFKIHHKELSPKSIVEIHRRYGKFAYEGIYEALEKIGENQPTQLGAFLKPVAYDAASYAFFGEEFDSRETYEPFVRFDSKVHLLQAGIPAFVFRDAIAGRELIVDSLVKYLNKPHSDCSQFVVSVEELAKMANWSLRDTASIFMTDVWAMQANAINAIYWLIALQLMKPEGLQPLIDEVDTVRNAWKMNNLDIEDPTQCKWILEGSFPRLTSAIQEALRISSSVISMRLVQEDTTFGGYRFHKGEKVLCATRAVHMDEEIHNSPWDFLPDRYLNGTKFGKKGKVVPNHTMPFGGGVSMCEGRHFTQGELKIFGALLLTLVDMKVASRVSGGPRFDITRVGMGIMPPVGDLVVRISKRGF